MTHIIFGEITTMLDDKSGLMVERFQLHDKAGKDFQGARLNINNFQASTEELLN